MTAALARVASRRRPATDAWRAAVAQVRTHRLANGMQLVVWPDHNIPHVALQNWVRVGSRNERRGRTGLAHFFEHMMFNGTRRRARGEFDRLLESRGGSNNAYTSQDVTVYQDWVPRSALELVFDLESDRLTHLAFEPAVIENERRIVQSERHLRIDDNNAAVLEEQVQATAFRRHPYRTPTIGWPEDIAAWTRLDLQRFYRRFYAPNNCTLILVGDVEFGEALALARRTFGRIRRGRALPPLAAREPAQHVERRVAIERPGQNPILLVAWHAIRATDPRAPALNLLQTVLAGGDASRLHRALVERQRLAVTIGAGWAESFDPNLFVVQATLPEGGSPDALLGALDAQLQRLLRDGISARELRRAKNLAAAEFWRAASSIDGKARLLGECAVIQGDHRRLFGAPEICQRVAPQELLQVARAIFQPARRTVGMLKPR
jgi:zinc protease